MLLKDCDNEDPTRHEHWETLLKKLDPIPVSIERFKIAKKVQNLEKSSKSQKKFKIPKKKFKISKKKSRI